MNVFYEDYKPLRNHLRKLNVEDSFYVVWNYFYYLQFNKILSNDIDIPIVLLNEKECKEKFCSRWELELLTREVLLNADYTSYVNKTLRKANYFAGAINKIKSLDSRIAEKFLNTNNIKNEILRIGYRQFPWQVIPNGEYFMRYYKIFNRRFFDKIFLETFNITIREFYLISMLLFGFFSKNVAAKIPITGIDIIENKKIDLFLDRFSIDILALRDRIKRQCHYDDRFFYTFFPLRAFPIVNMDYGGEECLVCPIPTLLFWQITDGIYYKIIDYGKEIKKKGEQKEFFGKFGNLLGESFEDYIGEINKKVCKNNLKYKKADEYFVGKDRKDSVDWLIMDKKAIIFLECKTKRINFLAKTELLSEKYLEDEFEKMAEYVIQVYKNIEDYKNNRYLNLRYEKNKKIFPIILTLEKWYFFDKIAKLDELITLKMRKSRLNDSYIKDYPYSICSSDEFEKMIQIIEKNGIDNFLSNKLNDTEKRLWDYTSFMKNEFEEDYKKTKNIFEEEYKALFDLKRYI
ncbi:MAG TPA: hypothetical protein PKU93_00550 [Candidatus Pacearchaeota archaeon]|nr:hypothetical protein [Candidatus Pacearchaeota archaeon]